MKAMKIQQQARNRRRGSILPLTALCLVGLCGFVALAVDVGMVAVAKTQVQNAADAAAVAATRSIDGSALPNFALANSEAQSAAALNPVLSVPLQSSELTITYGAYHYDPTSQTFYPQYPPQAPDNYNLAAVTVSHRMTTAFAAVLGIASTNVTASSTAAHRPRDVSIILDYSGSMNNESDLWNAETYLGSSDNTSNSLESVFPQFGHYSNVASAALQSTSGDPQVGKANASVAALGVPAMVGDYLQSARGATSTLAAFTPANASYATTPGGDNYLKTNGNTGGNYATNVNDITLNPYSSNFETKGYKQYTTTTFNGYTQGPNYWGKTFFIWPPDPTNDWRKQFFLKPGGSYPNFGGPVNDNTILWNANGTWKNPAGNYVINYAAILNWIKNTGPNPFPAQLRAGLILYYDKIPTDVPASAYDHTQANIQIADPTVRVWKEYIDYTLGLWRDPFGNIQAPDNPSCSIGNDFGWGTTQITAKPTGSSNVPYMSYQDNPLRPRHRMWFGPMTMIQYFSDTGLFPGTSHDISMYPAKLGISGALADIQNNHPNDLVSMIMFSRPQFANDPPGVGTFTNAQYTLSRDYSSMINSLFFPPNSGTNDVRPWDVNEAQTPSAHGDYCSNTTLKHGFMLAYNQFSSSAVVRSQIVAGQSVGGLGRKGAQRLVVCELDGMANYDSVPATGFTNAGPSSSYYNILPGQQVNGGNFDQNALLQVVQAVCNNSDGTPGNTPGYSPNPGYPGFATARKPMIVHTIAFGAIFEPTASGTQAASAVSLLQQISAIGGTVFPSTSTDPTNGYKWCIGNIAQRQAKLVQAFSKIMDDGIAVSLVQ
jgi:Flp pilus assembly protein TadG